MHTDTNVLTATNAVQGDDARSVVRVVRGRPTSDGAGVKLTRVIGQADLDMIDPFLMLDEFRSDSADDYIAGFPTHPHRGFETVTYMLAGRMRHGDNQGNSGLLTPGSVQWMTAGRGILHSEMPEQEDGLMWGFQLWVNLPAKDKMTAPRYQDIAPERIPEVALKDASVRVIAGAFADASGPVQDVATEPVYLDLRLQPGAGVDVPLPTGHNAFVYLYEGQARVGNGASNNLVRGDLGLLGSWRKREDRGTGRRGPADSGCRPAAQRTGRKIRPIRDEYAATDRAGRGRFPQRQVLNIAWRTRQRRILQSVENHTGE